MVALDVTAGAGTQSYNIAMEFKRLNEGVHGVLTAIGQSHAYLRKGYAGAVMVIPKAYPGLPDAGTYVREVLDLTSKSDAIGVFSYDDPDLAKPSPFSGKIDLKRPFKIDAAPPVPVPVATTETQWAHVREGSTEPDALFKYLQSVKLLGGGDFVPHEPHIPAQLEAAVNRLAPGTEPLLYLSNSTGNAVPDLAWRHFWYKYVLHDQMMIGWDYDPVARTYAVHHVESRVLRADGRGHKNFFSGKSNSPKNTIVAELARGALIEDRAWERLATNIRNRAHSYREDIDSGCEHLELVDGDGRLTDAGYRLVDACERTGNPNTGTPRALFTKVVLGDGGLGAFLHYVYRLSESKFAVNPLAFTRRSGARIQFKQDVYLKWLESELANNLRVMRKVSARGGVARKPFQGELALLRSLGIVGKGFRVGVGLPVNWPALQDALLE
ncbi:MAG: hypothetical protein ACREEL_07500 [Stellaceae bacterium]